MAYNLFINVVYWGYNPLILTFDPDFQRDILVPLAPQVMKRARIDYIEAAPDAMNFPNEIRVDFPWYKGFPYAHGDLRVTPLCHPLRK